MSTEGVKSIIDFDKHKGVYGALSVLVSITVVVLKLPEDQIQRIQDVWPVITIPAIIILVSTLFQAYLLEQKNRTRVEEKISAKLNEIAETFANSFDRVFANHLDDRMYFDKVVDGVNERFDGFDERQQRIYTVLEKRAEKNEQRSGDTERFLHST